MKGQNLIGLIAEFYPILKKDGQKYANNIKFLSLQIFTPYKLNKINQF
jgi:hypothetical protein